MKNEHHLCELLTPIEPSEAMGFITNPRFCVQVKEDGFRLCVQKLYDQVFGYDRKGQITAIPPEIAAELKALSAWEFFSDGELIGDKYIVWDLLNLNDEDLRESPYRERLFQLECLASHGTKVQLVPTWFEEKNKAEQILKLHQCGAEGVCFKDSEAVYRPGRAGQHFKFKFWDSATCRVARKLDRFEKRSIALEMLDGETWKPLGYVTVGPHLPVPNVGSFVEVKYLYGQSDGLYQPTLLGVRTDVDAQDCKLSQVKMRREWRESIPKVL